MGLVGLELWNLWVAAGVVAGFQVGAFRCDVICHLPARRHWGRGFGAAQLLNEPAALDRVEETTPSADGMDNGLYDADNPEEEAAIENEVTV